VAIQVLPSVNAVSAADWQRLGAARLLFETRDWLLANEPSLPGEPLVTAEFSDDGLESLIVWRGMQGPDRSAYHNVAALLARLTGEPSAVSSDWTLNCTGTGMHSPALAAPGISFNGGRLHDHILAASTIRNDPPAMCGFNFLARDPAPGLAESCAELGFLEIKGYQRAFLEICGDSYQGYLDRLTSRQRWNARRDRKRFGQTGQRISFKTGRGAAGDDLIQLQGHYRSKYGLGHDEDELRDKHAALLRIVGDDGLVIRSHRGDASTGFVMFFRMGSILHALFAGFEPTDEPVSPYFECLFHAAIEWACENDIKEIDYGIGATMAKSERGCRIEDISSWYLPPGSSLARPYTPARPGTSAVEGAP
jgi:Acetyltransferase (GNAT) domain